jgi:hypothetical protein
LIGGYIDLAEAANGQAITAVGSGDSAQYAVTTHIRQAPVWQSTGNVNLTAGSFLYVKITWEGTTAIYRFKINVGA